MSKHAKALNEHWYSPLVEGIQTYIPGNATYRTMKARSARTGTLFILPFIIGFLIFMAKPMVESFIMRGLIIGMGNTKREQQCYMK